MEGKMIKNLDTLTPRDKIQFIISGVLMFVGLVLMFVGLLVPPAGQIHQSVLIGFAEIATLAASILGIDAIYTNALQKIVSGMKQKDEEVIEK
jgi:cobalamin biosynthesis protein CobD/CbiB